MPDHTPLSAAELSEMRERCNAATDGPWTSEDSPDDAYDVCVYGPTDDWLANVGNWSRCNLAEVGADPVMRQTIEMQDLNDGRFVAHARTDLPRCLDEIDALKSELRLWKPMTAEEAEQVMSEIEAEPASEEDIIAMVQRVLDPAERLNNHEEMQLQHKILNYRLMLKLKSDEIDALRKKLAERERQLMKYGNHAECGYWCVEVQKCDCDWDAIRSTLSPAEG